MLAGECAATTLLSAPSWSTVAHIHALAPQQLIVDGTYLSINDYAINNPHVDIISNHFYTVNGNNNHNTIKQNLKKIAGKKAYMVGEFGLEDASVIKDIMETAVHHDVNGAKTVGAFIWGFRGHRHDGGFYFHKEGSGHYSYRLPGFKEADNNQENAIIGIVRNAIAGMDGTKVVPPLAVPEAPKLRKIISPTNIKWMGSPLGRHYRIERSENEAGPWKVIASNISDGKPQFNPAVDTLFSDTSTLKIDKPYYYRVIAKNESGESKPSNIQSLVIGQTTSNKFVTVQNGQFIKNGRPYYFVGANYWYGPLLGTSDAGLARMRIELDDMQIYQRIHQNPKIDYLTMHIWPKNWSWYDPKNESLSTLVAIEKATKYINQHIATADKLNKPIVLSEFGFPRDQESLSATQSTSFRNQFYQAVFTQIADSFAKQGTFAGSNFWGYAGIGEAGKNLIADPPQEPQGLNSVFSSDKQTLEIIREANARLH